MAIKVGMVSLGCAKNQVDGEMLMANLKNAGFELCDDAALADVAIVNTCGFIDSAKQESIDEILELATLKKEGRIKMILRRAFPKRAKCRCAASASFRPRAILRISRLQRAATTNVLTARFR